MATAVVRSVATFCQSQDHSWWMCPFFILYGGCLGRIFGKRRVELVSLNKYESSEVQGVAKQINDKDDKGGIASSQ